MNKCLGCGSILQNSCESEEGYVQNLESKLCNRCFKIKHYGEYKSIVKDNDTFINILKNINKNNSLVVLVVDIWSLPENFDDITNNLDNPILLVLTKRDLLPKSIVEERLLTYMDHYNLNLVDKIIVSSKNNYHLDELMEKITTYQTDDRVYVIGFTNAGKSTLINKLIYNYSTIESFLTTSILPSTTLNTIDIKLNDKLILVDTPGLLISGSIDNLVDAKMLKKIKPKKVIKPITYQITKRQYIKVEDLFELKLENNNITIFMSNELKIEHRFKETKLNFKSQTFNLDSNTDLVIEGLGFIKFTKEGQVQLKILDGIKVYTRKSFI